ncbi:hypothetical protein [Pimelobacter simplex]|uniref:hypothetical protein n=1 Tax=Nocardioides simplex TaxID=2045 RepID=UPI00214FD5F8|nr:hypothetical protein [Pimelobacter simplex]UUW92221.1 hypothetical protein M0M43_12285 [Pimelobacter simplex]UUW96047.1 hypothetical protein M0M48_00910 [Pimelobacter simplex]
MGDVFGAVGGQSATDEPDELWNHVAVERREEFAVHPEPPDRLALGSCSPPRDEKLDRCAGPTLRELPADENEICGGAAARL